ncbi:hypothetical protein [Lacipirellula sp.]|uniref:hypothetical protein n=1 Tax=Lacipirellula sp. TaxID=2691419 RepID=UPI003D126329
MTKFERAWAALVSEVVGGAGVVFDGDAVMNTFGPVGVPGSGVPTCGSVHAIQRALKHTSGLSASAIQRRLGELVGITTASNLQLTRSGATKFVFVALEVEED